MPKRPGRTCSRAGCQGVVRDEVCSRCGPLAARNRQARRQHDQQRGSSAERGYGARWQRARARFLAEHPLCVLCLREGVSEAATVVDHVQPHRGDVGLFWDVNNWQALCKRHHDEKTSRGE